MSKDQEIIDMGWDKYMQGLDDELSFVDVGVLAKDGAQGEFPLAQLAAVQEFGTVINVSEKMRGYLGATGLHLKAETKQIIIPSRSYLRGTFDEQESELSRLADSLEMRVIQGKETRRSALSVLGQSHRQQIQRNMKTKGKYAPNHQYTKDRKGSSTPLIDTGRLRQSIDYEVG